MNKSEAASSYALKFTDEFLNIRAELALRHIFLNNYQETRTLYTL